MMSSNLTLSLNPSNSTQYGAAAGDAVVGTGVFISVNSLVSDRKGTEKKEKKRKETMKKWSQRTENNVFSQKRNKYYVRISNFSGKKVSPSWRQTTGHSLPKRRSKAAG
jgi:hypothetical protein